MKTYITKPKSIRINDIKKNNSYSIKDFYEIKNSNFVVLKDFLLKSFINSNIDSGFYFSKSNYFLVSNKSLNSNILLDNNKFTGVSLKGFETKNKCVIKKNDILIGNNGTLGQIGFVKEDFNGITNSNITLLRFKKGLNIFYFLGVFYTKWFNDYCSIISTKSGTQEFITRSSLENLKIPFPSKNNNPEPEKVEKLISFIVQNLIDKEEQIKRKNILIDEMIERELKENQKGKEKEYNFPSINEIKEVGRLDTGMYEKEFKKVSDLIENYKYGNFFLEKEDLKGGNTPKKRFFEPEKKEFLWFTPTDINKGLLGEKKYIKSEKYNLGKDFALLFSNRSNCGECILYSPEYYFGGQHNQGIYRKIFKGEKLNKNIFISVLFNSYFFQKMIGNIANGGTFDELRIEQYIKIKIPNFPDLKQEEIAKEYYNKVEKNFDLDFGDYLEKEKERNEKLGIFQLNMEIFELREVLEILVDKVVLDEEIEINFEY